MDSATHLLDHMPKMIVAILWWLGVAAATASADEQSTRMMLHRIEQYCEARMKTLPILGKNGQSCCKFLCLMCFRHNCYVMFEGKVNCQQEMNMRRNASEVGWMIPETFHSFCEGYSLWQLDSPDIRNTTEDNHNNTKTSVLVMSIAFSVLLLIVIIVVVGSVVYGKYSKKGVTLKTASIQGKDVIKVKLPEKNFTKCKLPARKSKQKAKQEFEKSKSKSKSMIRLAHISTSKIEEQNLTSGTSSLEVGDGG